jgi:tRNA pseudouridine55 synthase
VSSPDQTTPSGLLLIDKPVGPTSMDVCRRVRRGLVDAGAPKRIKVGHGGTLDPMASGLVVVLVGKATKQCEQVMAGTKRYLAEIDLAHRSPTDDLEGELEPVPVDRPPTREQVEPACRSFVGATDQIPPIFSALKQRGMPVYRAARRGEAVQMQPRRVQIHSIDIIEYEYPRLVLDVSCGKGTYIRSLARDIGAALGTGGMLRALRRTAVGGFTLEQAVSFDDVPGRLTQADLLPGSSTFKANHRDTETPREQG